MEEFLSKKEIDKMEKNAKKAADKMFNAAKGVNSIEAVYASMRIIAFILSQNFENRDQAYEMMAELFDVGDRLLQELEEEGIAIWSEK